MKCGRVKDKMRKDFRIGIIQTHPTQHHGPWWRKLNEQEGISVKVFYLTNQNQRGGDPDFKTKNPWDEDFVGGYEHEFLKTINGKITDKLSCFIAQFMLEYFCFELIDNANYTILIIFLCISSPAF